MAWKEREREREKKPLGIHSHCQAIAVVAPVAHRRAAESQAIPGKALVAAIALSEQSPAGYMAGNKPHHNPPQDGDEQNREEEKMTRSHRRKYTWMTVF
jgi:hypothetical protein